MFNKAPERDGSPVNGIRPASQRGTANTASVIGADLVIKGNLECKGEVQIDGQVEGDIHAQSIVVGDRARTTGNLVAESVEVGGNVQGSIRGNSVTFRSSGRVEADVFHKTLTIEQGAFFEGKSRRSDNPMSMQGATQAILPGN
jgi:cytoskeletal protein CcmA (bactofilin family)